MYIIDSIGIFPPHPSPRAFIRFRALEGLSGEEKSRKCQNEQVYLKKKNKKTDFCRGGV